MNTLVNNYDAIEQLILKENIKIQAIDVHPEMDLLLIILNTGSVLQEKISKYKLLQNATGKALLNYELTGKGTGIHWPELDEDLSLKGFLRDALKNQIIGNKVA